MAFEGECHQEAEKAKVAGEDRSRYRHIPRKRLTIQAKPLEESGEPGEERPEEKTLEQRGVKPGSTMAVPYADPAEQLPRRGHCSGGRGHAPKCQSRLFHAREEASHRGGAMKRDAAILPPAGGAPKASRKIRMRGSVTRERGVPMCEAYREAQWQAARDDLVTWLESSPPGASPAQSSSERPSAHPAPPSAPNRTDDGGGLGVVLTRNQLIHHWQRSRECRSPNQSEGRWRAAGACYMGPPSLRWCGRPLGIHLPRLGSPHTLARSIGDPPRSHRAHPRVGPGNAYVAERGDSER